MEAFPAELASRGGVSSENRGPIIVRVDPNGPARGKALAPASPQQGVLDIITHVNDQRVRTVSELEDALGNVLAGSIVSLRVHQVRGSTGGSSVVRLRAGN